MPKPLSDSRITVLTTAPMRRHIPDMMKKVIMLCPYCGSKNINTTGGGEMMARLESAENSGKKHR